MNELRLCWVQHGGKATVSSLYHLDATRLSKKGVFTDSGEVDAYWTDENGDTAAKIKIISGVDQIGLNFSVNGNPKNQTVPLSRTPCHFGGTVRGSIAPIAPAALDTCTSPMMASPVGSVIG